MFSLKKWMALRCAILLVFISGCASTGKSVALGSGVGATAGAGIGAIADPGANGQYRTRNILIGGALGAITGGITGALIHSSVEDGKEESFKSGQAQAPKEVIDPNEPPKLIPAQWRAEVVSAKRIGNRFVPKHVEYIITDQARWEDAP